tara:strand:+ start:118567 stop:119460 length:894 start_codon:yes stop_codon:yes gene_type:complete
MAKCYIGHLAYNGSGFYGWQKQKDMPTLQQTVLDTLDKIYPEGKNNRAFAASRTDSGVHALAQPLKIELGRRVDAKELESLLNENFPSHLKIFNVKRINPSFKITHYTKDKEYFYFLSKKIISQHPFVQSIGEFDVEKFNELSKQFLGEHDFSRFQIKSTVKGNMKRKISSISLEKASQIPELSGVDEEVYVFRIQGNGFLKQMVRLIVGSLVQSVLGEKDENYISELLNVNSELARPFLMPASPLFLYKINYPYDEKYEERNVIDLQLWKEDDSFHGLSFFNDSTEALQNLNIQHQ